MKSRYATICMLIWCFPASVGAQATKHKMFSMTSGDGWLLTGMAQARPILTKSWSAAGDTPFDTEALYLTHTSAMLNLESPSRRFVLRFTPNFEGLTLSDGELNIGSWGNGFIDSRHPHNLFHEAMVSFNAFDSGGGGFSLSAGKGFVPYGTDDPMGRPPVKYPTNHHLSQVLERFTLNAVWSKGAWILEGGVFGGSHSQGPYDLSNIESFGDSWSTRVTRRFGKTAMGGWSWELSASHARIHHGKSHKNALYNGALRFDAPVENGQHIYGLMEYSRSTPAGNHEHGYWSFLTEAQWSTGPHTPYARFETSIRPEFSRGGGMEPSFFRYGHHAKLKGATGWSILSLGYGFTSGGNSVSITPFVEGQIFHVTSARGDVTPMNLFGAERLAALTVGARLHFGGDPMRMGRYGILDPVTSMTGMPVMSNMQMPERR